MICHPWHYIVVNNFCQVIIKPTPGGSELPELYDVVTPKGATGDKIKLKIAVKMDKPGNLKKCG